MSTLKDEMDNMVGGFINLFRPEGLKYELPEDRERKEMMMANSVNAPYDQKKLAGQYGRQLETLPKDTDWSIKAALRIASEANRLLAEPYITQIARIIREEQPKP